MIYIFPLPICCNVHFHKILEVQIVHTGPPTETVLYSRSLFMHLILIIFWCLKYIFIYSRDGSFMKYYISHPVQIIRERHIISYKLFIYMENIRGKFSLLYKTRLKIFSGPWSWDSFATTIRWLLVSYSIQNTDTLQ